ncbi:F0F1 ATP synthase subunit delta [Paenibacillus sp. 481]|uniref:F0F1 ATP synthase subunit delta n=1 Tax=Paenibacillus sp. 481 TaxID=2835869 RepID=UPI001E374BDA|nr:F0F1 ATP synthase subunit delta [Paenibacillus sp. 481]UHA75661.1 F0F1 ATP synthase subunit delta [Paenibacillus sp. 481]
MSQETVVAKRYAKALFELAQERQAVAETEQQLKLIAELLHANRELKLLLTSPNVNLADKSSVLKGALQGHVSDFVLNTLDMLIERGRIHALQDVANSYVRIAGAAIGLVDAEVTSAYALSEEEKQVVAFQFGSTLGKSVRVHNVVNASILGGMQVRIGDRLYDGSLSSKLTRMEKTLKSQAR